jgi:hypothetical protein
VNVIDAIIRYEESDLDEDEFLDLFQHLAETGLAWSLQGHYGRVTSRLIEEGLVTL